MNITPEQLFLEKSPADKLVALKGKSNMLIKNITQPGIYAGSPVLPMKKYVQSNAIYQELGELRKMVLDLSKKLEQNK